MKVDPYIGFSAAGWRGVIDPAWHAVLGSADPVAALWTAPHEVVHRRRIASTWRVQLDGKVLYAKRMTGWKDRDPGLEDLAYKVRWVVGGSLAMRTFRVCREMQMHGLKSPKIVVAARRRRGLRCEEVFVTEAVAGASLYDVLAGATQDQRLPICRFVGSRVADFHRAGFVHGHLLPGHLFLTPGRDDVVFLDNDETWRPWLAGLGAAHWYNLEQMSAHLLWLDDEAHTLVHAFVGAHLERVGLSADAALRRRQGIVDRAVERWTRHRNKRLARLGQDKPA